MKTALTVAAALLFLQGCASEPAAEPSSEVPAPACPNPAYPEAALKERKEGTTKLRYYVNESGVVTKSEVIGSSGSFLLDMAAQGAIASCRFPPTIRDRVAVSVTAETEYVWRLPPEAH